LVIGRDNTQWLHPAAPEQQEKPDKSRTKPTYEQWHLNSAYYHQHSQPMKHYCYFWQVEHYQYQYVSEFSLLPAIQL
jgi:hypothetical protein